MARLEVDWTEEKITDESLWDLFHPVAKKLTGLVLQVHADGRVLIFTDPERRVRHAVSNLDDNNWGCFCPDALDGECAATTFARARLMKDLEEHG
jgi:hypothetical protein